MGFLESLFPPPRIIEPTPMGPNAPSMSVQGAAPAAPTVAPSPKPTAPAGGKRKPWDLFGPVVFDTVPVTVGRHRILVTRVPANVTIKGGITVYPPFTLADYWEYGLGNRMLPLTAAVFDALHLQGWFHEPIVGWYDVAKNMNTPDLIVEHGRKWTAALKSGGYSPDKGPVANIQKAWIYSPAGIAKPGFAVNRGFYMQAGTAGIPPLQKEGTAHTATYTDLQQGFWAAKDRTEDGASYNELVQAGELGPAVDTVAFWKAAGVT